MVGGEENHRLVFQARSWVAGHGGYLDGYRFQLSQRKRRLGQDFLMFQGGLGGLFVQRGYVQFVHDGCKWGRARMREKRSVPMAVVSHMSRMARSRSPAVASFRPEPIQG